MATLRPSLPTATLLRARINLQGCGQRKDKSPKHSCRQIRKEQLESIIPNRFGGPNLRDIFISEATLFYHVPGAFILGEGTFGKVGPVRSYADKIEAIRSSNFQHVLK